MEHKPCEENHKKQLALAIRNIQWTYAIFWSPSPNDSGVLQWENGYYNGGIKTRKTILSIDIKANDQTFFQRSNQLRELYHSLLSTNTNTTQTRRPLAALLPEDLTDVEWFYLVCMSFVFKIGQGLPGTSFETGRTIWLTNAHLLDTGLFTRSLLAKSAGVKTVVCFPFREGVIELGVTESVEEDFNIIQHVRDLLLENPTSPQDAFAPPSQGLDMELISPTGSSNGAELIQPLSDFFLLEQLNGVMEDDQSSNCVHAALASSDCISQTLMYPENPPISENLHNQSTLSSLSLKSDQGFLQQFVEQNLDKKSGFVGWKKGANEKMDFSEVTPQYMLKKILFEVPKMHSVHSIESKEDNVGKDELCKQEVPNTNHVLAERRRREKVNERFSTLRSLIPSITKTDKISILDDTISYLKELERRVEELETSQESTGFNMKKKRKTVDIEERTSDNYGNDINVGAKNKRKGHNVENLSTRESLIDNTITVSMVDQETLINISCRWRETLLIQIIDAMRNLHLDSQSVHSSTVDGILSLKIQSTVKGSNNVSVEFITQTLLEIIQHKQAR